MINYEFNPASGPNFSKPTPESLGNALDVMGEWFPEHKLAIKKFRFEIIGHILNNTSPDSGSELGKFSSADALKMNPLNAKAGVEIIKPQQDPLSWVFGPCVDSSLKAAFTGTLFILGIIGFKASLNPVMVNTFIAHLGNNPVVKRMIVRQLIAFRTASGSWDRACSFFSLAGSFYRAGCFKALLKLLFDEMRWYDVVRIGAVAIAQLLAWFGSGGLAFISSVGLMIDSAVSFIESLTAVFKECSCDPDVMDDIQTFAPGGSYTSTAEEITVLFFARCAKPGDVSGFSNLEIQNDSINYEYENHLGELKRSAGPGTKRPLTFLPLGSYHRTCHEASVRLIVTLRDEVGNKVYPSMDVTDLPIDTKFANINGKLQIEEKPVQPA